MVAGELPDLAGEPDRAIAYKDLGLADAAGVQQDLAGGGVTGRVLVAEAEIEIAARDPLVITAPPHMDNALAIRQHRRETLTGARRQRALEPREKREWPGGDADIAHADGSGSRLRISTIPAFGSTRN